MAIRQEIFTSDEKIGERLRAWRKEIGLNQTQLAELGGVSLNSQHRYEAGALPSTEYLLRIGSAGADWYWIVTGQRIAGAPLDDEAAAMLEAFAALPAAVKLLLVQHAQGLCRALESNSSA
ncbi:hypothetical protein AWL63_19150 [Sphingomonas panacis]|uniref:HTH cro/C1-type domain-containing protein n=1 Tax=Sphingomonas panacis TaxID=1560345 RepID=A0A1B3ZE85_9SPHN|nr:helix-turn-helix transcriptional regulator [Sphingomonas panacis]AOH85748.1 hypothetical protein AWL63_19150 [Sphingomonas panacis]